MECCNKLSLHDFLLNDLKKENWARDVLEAAARNGHLPCFKAIFEKVLEYRSACDWKGFDVCEGAAKYGHLEVLKYAAEQGFDVPLKTLRLAKEKGHVQCYEYAKQVCISRGLLYSEESKRVHQEDRIQNLLEAAVKENNLEVVKFLFEHK
jgi:hypothetical protein